MVVLKNHREPVVLVLLNERGDQLAVHLPINLAPAAPVGSGGTTPFEIYHNIEAIPRTGAKVSIL